MRREGLAFQQEIPVRPADCRLRGALAAEKVSSALESTIRGGCALSGSAAMRTALRWSTTAEEVSMAARKTAPVHPGEILMEEFLQPLGISQYRLSKDISVAPRRINEIVHGKRAISPDTALRLARYFGMTETFWSNLQVHYDLQVERDRLGSRLEKEVVVYARSR
jgi:addiction module HigA family antidote